MNCLMSATVCVRLNLATILDPSARRSWMDVAGSDSLTPAHGVEDEEAGVVVEVLDDAPLEGPEQHLDHVKCLYFMLDKDVKELHWNTGTVLCEIVLHHENCCITQL